jgi:signal peptidase I
MSKSTLASPSRRDVQSQPADPLAEGLDSWIPSGMAIRETIESIVVAFVLAFLFRTFEAEAFVIPTGSMAPTLMGRHKDLVCPQCGAPYQASASDELDEWGNSKGSDHLVRSSICPMCRFPADLTSPNVQGKEYPSFKGDRILVGKFFYDFVEPERWDVAVFKFPGKAWMNYIKRIVGLPGETIRVREGNLYVKPPADNGKPAEFTIARKPPHQLLTMLQPVYDNDYQVSALSERGWPARWQPEHVMARIFRQGGIAWPPDALASLAAPPGSWRRVDGDRTLVTDGTAQGDVWIRYGQFMPSGSQWERVRSNMSLGGDPPRLDWIKDFTPYNTSRSGLLSPNDFSGRHWTNDLAVETQLDIRGSSGEVLFDLIRSGRRFICRIDVATGQANLEIGGLGQFRSTAATSIRGPGRYNLMFSNIDQQMLLWVDRRVVATLDYPKMDDHDPQDEDYSPVGIGTRGVAMEARHVKVWRDIYYTPDRNWPSDDFPLAADQFFVLGDNSARSKDGRQWPGEAQYLNGPPLEHYVKRELLIGRALFVYWPHSWDSISLGSIDIPIPFLPNVQRMRPVR